jgi:hypothetical protein
MSGIVCHAILPGALAGFTFEDWECRLASKHEQSCGQQELSKHILM